MIFTEREARRSKDIDRMSSFRGAFRYRNREKAANALVRELKGEPSQAFFPPKEDFNIATQEDIQKRMNEQNQRCVELWHYADWNAGGLPVSWRVYLVKHWDDIRMLLSPSESSLS